MNPPTTLTNHNPPATIGCGLNPNPIRREESDTPHSLHQRPPRHTTPDNNTTNHPSPLRPVRTTRCDGLINEYKHAA